MPIQNSSPESKLMEATPKKKLEELQRLPKRLTYILRYGAIKEGLTVDENGYVPLDELPCLNLLSCYSRDEIKHEIESSVSYRTNHRFEIREKDGQIKVRAAYLRRFEENPVHTGTNVKTLTEITMSYILTNLDDYDLETFPDGEMIRRMIRRLKREKKLTVKVLQAVLVPALTMLDLEGVYINNNVLKTIYRQCPDLTHISFKGCGYIMTDNILSQIVKNLPDLEKLNLCQCNHLTSNCLNILAKRLPRLNTLLATGVPSLTFESVLGFLNKAKALVFLDIYFMLYSQDEYQHLMDLAESKHVTLILRKPKKSNKKVESNSDPSSGEPDAESSSGDPDADSSSGEPEVDLRGWDHYKAFIFSNGANPSNVDWDDNCYPIVDYGYDDWALEGEETWS